MNTYRRDKLMRLVKQGRVVMVGAYHYDDMCGASSSNVEMPVAMYPDDRKDRKEGVCYLGWFEFKTKSGCCYQNPDGTVALIVHSNCNYTFRIIGE